MSDETNILRSDVDYYRQRAEKAERERDEARQQLAECQAELTRLRGVRDDQPDPVKAPAHYTAGKIECWDAIRAMLGDEGFVSFCRGTVVKYLWRAPHKGAELEDYKKAKAYLEKLTSVKEQP